MEDVRKQMGIFIRAKQIRLRSHNDKYLMASEDEETVYQDHDGSAKNAVWKVEFVQHAFKNKMTHNLRLKSCFGTYLSASNISILKGFAAKKVVQLKTSGVDDNTIEWEPVRHEIQMQLKSMLYGTFLRPNGFIPPWKHGVTHDVPHREITAYNMSWDIEIVVAKSLPPPMIKPLDISACERSHSVPASPASKKKVTFKSMREAFVQEGSAIFSKKPVAGSPKHSPRGNEDEGEALQSDLVIVSRIPVVASPKPSLRVKEDKHEALDRWSLFVLSKQGGVPSPKPSPRVKEDKGEAKEKSGPMVFSKKVVLASPNPSPCVKEDKGEAKEQSGPMTSPKPSPRVKEDKGEAKQKSGPMIFSKKVVLASPKPSPRVKEDKGEAKEQSGPMIFSKKVVLASPKPSLRVKEDKSEAKEQSGEQSGPVIFSKNAAVTSPKPSTPVKEHECSNDFEFQVQLKD